MIIDVKNLCPGDIIARDVGEFVAVFDHDVPLMVISSVMNENEMKCDVHGLCMSKAATPLVRHIVIDRSNIREYRLVLKTQDLHV